MPIVIISSTWQEEASQFRVIFLYHIRFYYLVFISPTCTTYIPALLLYNTWTRPPKYSAWSVGIPPTSSAAPLNNKNWRQYAKLASWLSSFPLSTVIFVNIALFSKCSKWSNISLGWDRGGQILCFKRYCKIRTWLPIWDKNSNISTLPYSPNSPSTIQTKTKQCTTIQAKIYFREGLQGTIFLGMKNQVLFKGWTTGDRVKVRKAKWR